MDCISELRANPRDQINLSLSLKNSSLPSFTHLTSTHPFLRPPFTHPTQHATQPQPPIPHTFAHISPYSLPHHQNVTNLHHNAELSRARQTQRFSCSLSSCTTITGVSSARLTNKLFQHGLTTQDGDQPEYKSIDCCAVYLRSHHLERGCANIYIYHVDCMSRVATNLTPIHQRATTDQLRAIVVGSKFVILITACELAQITNAMCFSIRFRHTRFSAVLQLPRIK